MRRRVLDGRKLLVRRPLEQVRQRGVDVEWRAQAVRVRLEVLEGLGALFAFAELLRQRDGKERQTFLELA